jgi:hypothetical protein
MEKTERKHERLGCGAIREALDSSQRFVDEKE